jgi:hypothetical protein
MWNKFKDRFDFLWKGDSENLISMWFVIVLCLAVLADLGITIYNAYINHCGT